MDWTAVVINACCAFAGAAAAAYIVYMLSLRREKLKEKEVHSKMIKAELIKIVSNINTATEIYKLFYMSQYAPSAGIKNFVFLDLDTNAVSVTLEYLKTKTLITAYHYR
jgi:hypothetical protein